MQVRQRMDEPWTCWGPNSPSGQERTVKTSPHHHIQAVHNSIGLGVYTGSRGVQKSAIDQCLVNTEMEQWVDKMVIAGNIRHQIKRNHRLFWVAFSIPTITPNTSMKHLGNITGQGPHSSTQWSETRMCPIPHTVFYLHL